MEVGPGKPLTRCANAARAIVKTLNLDSNHAFNTRELSARRSARMSPKLVVGSLVKDVRLRVLARSLVSAGANNFATMGPHPVSSSNYPPVPLLGRAVRKHYPRHRILSLCLVDGRAASKKSRLNIRNLGELEQKVRSQFTYRTRP